MFDERFPLSKQTVRLFGQLEAKLPSRDKVLAAVGLSKGPPPGVEGAALPLIGAMIDLWVGILVAFGISKVRRRYVLAVTADRVVLFGASCSGKPVSVEASFDFNEISEISDTVGDPFIDLDGESYWINDFGDQVYRLRRVMSRHGTRRDASP
ncbi:MAG: hypothetical protein AAFY28_03850 [Actinomycetota bacterium]